MTTKNQAILTVDMWRSLASVVAIAHRAATPEYVDDVKKVYDFIQSDDCKMIITK